ncbi:chemotaxis protein CheA [mine drainage metagenome]|uniref:Chemotaxis protein CheA n=1 Tax=mine drainage metagenome TaxID=410659 RepID=A0A1J5RTG5_9ZZZZ
MSPDPAAVFRQEAQDLFEQLEQALLDLERLPGDQDLINTAFRALHTVKGSGAMFGFDALARFTHHLESAFDGVRNGKAVASPGLISLTLSAIDHMRALMDPSAAQPDPEGEALIGRLRQMTESAAPPQAAATAAATAADAPGESTYRIRFRLPADALERGINPLLLLDELRALGPCRTVALTGRLPPLEALPPGALFLDWEVMLTTAAPRSAIDDVFIFVFDDMDLQVERLADPEAGPRLGEILVERDDAAPEAEAPAVSGDSLKSALNEQTPLRQAAPGRQSAGDSIRIQAQHLDELIDRVGQLVIAQARLKQLAASEANGLFKPVAEEIERLSNELRDTTMGIRMVPIGSLFGRFRRLVRDLAEELGKDILLTTAGEETELDKTVIERLNDPLVHLVRNALDHGIESPEQRQAAGKPRQGRVQLSAVHSGAQVLISIKDDGRGLDLAAIRARAEENGLIPPGARLSDQELYLCIFQPGFSTARAVSSLSGRGVGMDVVKRAIEGLRGLVEVGSSPGQGTEITLRLPLTLAIIDGLLIRVGRGRYIIPLAAVEECVELSLADDLRSKGRSFLNLRGDLVPFLRLRDLFASPLPADPFQKVVIVSSGEQRVGLVVDQVIGDHQTVIKSLSRLHADVESFSGATILGDGSVALILDVPHLVEAGQRHDALVAAS